jgi:uncharacterized protein (TIGR02271 family)
MLTEQDARQAIGSTVYSTSGDKIGKVGQLFLDDETQRPEFITVNTGLFGTNETFIPVADAELSGDRLTVPFEKDKVKDAPNVAADGGHLDQDEERRLYEYYGLSYSESRSDTGLADGVSGDGVGGGVGGVAGTDTDYDRTETTTGHSDTATTGTGADTDTGTDTGTGYSDTDREFAGSERSAGHDTSGPNTDDAMTRSEEQLRVGTTQEQAGRARLRKYVVTEEETHTVPVRKEKAVLETEPVTDANVGEATSGPDISEEEHEVTLNEERAVVSKETTPVERVRLGTEEVTEEQTVTEDVRKERIEAEGDIDRR